MFIQYGWRSRNRISDAQVLHIISLAVVIAHYQTYLSLLCWIESLAIKMAMCINQCKGRIFLLFKKKSHAGQELPVNWSRVCQPKSASVLSVPDLKATRLALRTHWLWMQRTTENQSWNGLKIPHNDTELSIFKAAAQIHIGNAKNTLFLKDHWLMEYHQHPVEYGPKLAQLYLFAATHLSMPGGLVVQLQKETP